MKHGEALTALETRCPRCGAAREANQEYCVECGLRLPPLRGPIPALRRRWVRRVGWYPGDWIWVSLVTFAVAAAGAAVAIAIGSGPSSAAGTTVVAPPPASVPVTTAPLPTTPAQTTPATTSSKPAKTTPSPPSTPVGHTPWPANRNGWTIVLFSYPASAGTGAPTATAVRAARDGLPQVGVLDSAQYSSLHPGYYVVFSGVYSTSSEAAAALNTVHAAGFASAYTRQIAR
ncbi:MAG TPA: hypothetical protein VGL76_10090 [Gaiellaceae bacterium]